MLLNRNETLAAWEQMEGRGTGNWGTWAHHREQLLPSHCQKLPHGNAGPLS